MLRIAKLSSLILGALLLVTVAKADSHEGKGHVDVHGALDVFWNTNMNSGQTGGAYTPLAHDDVTIGLATINFAGSVKHVDYYVEMAYGSQSANTAATGNADVSQAYITTHINDQVSVTAGRMATNFGFEGAFAKDNWNYSRSLAFGNGSPLWHEGIAVRYNHNSGFNAGVFYYDGENQINQGNAETTHSSSIQLGYSQDKWAVVYNYFANKDAGNELFHNLNFTYDFNSKFSGALAYASGEGDESGDTDEWSSIALYLKYMTSKKTYAAFRYEQFTDDDHALDNLATSTTGSDESVSSITFTYGLYCDSGSEWRFEVRQDSADNEIFVDDEGAAEDAQMNVSAAWIHTF